MMIFSLFLLLQINFASMQLTEKKSRHKKNLRRSHFEGVYAQVALSEHLQRPRVSFGTTLIALSAELFSPSPNQPK